MRSSSNFLPASHEQIPCGHGVVAKEGQGSGMRMTEILSQGLPTVVALPSVFQMYKQLAVQPHEEFQQLLQASHEKIGAAMESSPRKGKAAACA